MKHPLHMAVADAIASSLQAGDELIRDPACGGSQQLPLFVGTHKRYDTRMCCVDCIIIRDEQLRVIVEIEESGFLPTKICGKFLQSALANRFIDDSQEGGTLAYGARVLFMQVLDGSACLRPGSRKRQQGELIESEIRGLLPLRGLTDYSLHFVNGASDTVGLSKVAGDVIKAMAQRGVVARNDDCR
jgi:hypothetical protein